MTRVCRALPRRGAELRVKQWRDRDEGTGTGDTPAVVPSSAVDAPPPPSVSITAHPEWRARVGPLRRLGSVGCRPDGGVEHRRRRPRLFLRQDDAEATMLDGHLSDAQTRALHGEGFFNLGSDGNLDARDVVDSAAETKRELARARTWRGRDLAPSERRVDEDAALPGSSGGTFNPWGFGDDSGVDDGPDDGPDDGMRKSTLELHAEFAVQGELNRRSWAAGRMNHDDDDP